jgi:hypothetical protein
MPVWGEVEGQIRRCAEDASSLTRLALDDTAYWASRQHIRSNDHDSFCYAVDLLTFHVLEMRVEDVEQYLRHAYGMLLFSCGGDETVAKDELADMLMQGITLGEKVYRVQSARRPKVERIEFFADDAKPAEEMPPENVIPFPAQYPLAPAPAFAAAV